jgi:acetylornithine deacetylase/succinyl-diaminopimelate desuccinylase-like protein
MNSGAAELAFLADREDELVEFTRELIRTPSVNPPGDERAVVGVASRGFPGPAMAAH